MKKRLLVISFLVFTILSISLVGAINLSKTNLKAYDSISLNEDAYEHGGIFETKFIKMTPDAVIVTITYNDNTKISYKL